MKNLRSFTMICVVFAIVLFTSSCGVPKESNNGNEKSITKNDVNIDIDIEDEISTEKQIKNFEIELSEGWTENTNQARSDMKSYIFLKNYVASAFIMMQNVSPEIFEGTVESINNYYAGSDGKAPFNIISADKMDIIGYPAVRCITDVISNNTKQIQYYIDAEGSKDLYITITLPADKVNEAKDSWDEMLKTLKLEY